MFFIVLAVAAAIAFLRPATAAPTARVNRRDWVPTNPQAFEVDIGFDQAGRYVITIGMVSHQAGRAVNPEWLTIVAS